MSNKVNEKIRDEKRLISLLKQGQEEGFRLLVRHYQTRLLKIAYGITLDREESLDIVQEVFLKVHRNIGHFREASKLSTWLHRITVNQCLNWRRRWKRRFRWHHESIDQEGQGDHRALGTDDYDPETVYQNREMRETLWRALRELPEEARAVFVMRELEGLSYDEIAKVLKIKKGTVSSRLFHARKRLRQGLKPYLEQG
ncbi:MAG: sigma-70 family RNA polymerase sigma factor [Thermodesulfobacteriota bacterium]|nr:sigma-70 family RNA polymerase sigma factor [Thermodesulfobacteriota bacterium]